MKNIVWLASYLKSGNTWLRALLTAYLTDGSSPFDFKAMDVFTTSESLVSDYVARAGKPREDLDEATVDSLRKEVQQALSARTQRPFWVKTHNANIVHRGQRLIFPELTHAAVYIVRNPLDVVDSLADHSGQTIAEAIRLLNNERHAIGGPAAVHVKQYLGTWSQHVLSWLREKEFPILPLRYEDMHTDSFAVFSRVIRFLGWPVDEARLRRAIERTSFCNLQQLEQQRGFAERNPASRSGRFFRRGKYDVWQAILSRKQAEQIVAKHSEAMQSVGYPAPNMDGVYRERNSA